MMMMAMMPQFKEFTYFLLSTFLVFLRCSNDGAELDGCDPANYFRCSNDRCIELDRVNNSVNDCIDNSDEGLKVCQDGHGRRPGTYFRGGTPPYHLFGQHCQCYDCMDDRPDSHRRQCMATVAYPCRAPLFSCRNNRCVFQAWVLDGNNDCIDGSDEAKLIGKACNLSAICCHCDEYVPHSHCDNGICRCSKGFFSNQLGTVCQQRVVGSECRNNSECSETIVNSYCSLSEQRCTCDDGYEKTENRTHCERRLLGDRCETRIDCQTVEHSRCIAPDSACSCDTGYAESPNRKSCVAVLLNDTCHADSDCLAPGSVCQDRHCACPTGFFYNTTSRDVCVRRLLGNDCDADDDCASVIDDAFCAAGRCACADERVATSRDGVSQSCVASNDVRDVTVVALGIFLLSCLVIFDSFLVIWMVLNFVCKPRTIAEKLGTA